jgi:amino acid adenylation domain-containing protein
MRPARRISVDSNDSRIHAAEEKCVHELFQQQVRCAPHSIAIVFEEQRLTYGVLNARANQLARHLSKLGVSPDVAVGLCLDRSVDLIVGLLGILKAGGAYVPLDPSLPKSRLSMIVADAGARVLVTRSDLTEGLSDHLDSVVCVDADARIIANESSDNSLNAVSDQNLVYLIFTSGSTGRPKGVAVEHRQLVNYINAIWETLDLPVGSSFAAVSTIAADLGNTALFPALCKGGTLHLIAEERATDPDALADYFGRNQIDCLKIVPTHLSALLSGSNPAGILPRRRLVLGGEACPWSLVERIASLSSKCVVLNHYGPTEATVGAIAGRLEGENNERLSDTVPLGRPIANVQAYVLDQRMEPEFVGTPGELYIGGAGLARGYINGADATAESFVPNPFSNDGARLYKTGDRARYLADGRIEFLGRVDYQVKIRGYRIELGEIEMVISQHPGVRDTVVVAREDEPGDKRLVAYVVPGRKDSGGEVSVNEGRQSEQFSQSPADRAENYQYRTLLTDLRRLLTKRLPEHMMPSAFVLLGALPLTANGKIDRRALPAPCQSRPELETDYAAPRTTEEDVLAAIWSKVLKLEQVGVNDNFFHLGGHSLVAVRLFAEIENKFGIKLPLSSLFEAPTISQLAAILRRGSCPSWSSIVPIQPHGTRPPLFCVHACGAHVFIYRPLVVYLGPDQPVYGLQAQGIDGRQEPYSHIEDMAAHYVREVRDLEPHGPYYLVGDTLGGLIAFEIAQQLETQGENVAFLAMFDTACPLPLSLGPRVLSHLSHLRQLGPRKYLHSATGSIAKKLGMRFPDHSVQVPLSTKEQEFADGVSASGDAVQRTEWGIYLATQVNYRPPQRRFGGRITYFLARDNHYGSGEKDSRRNWKRGATEFEVHVIPGRHNTIRDEPFVAVLAEKFIASLSQAHDRDLRFTKRQASPTPH